jgi:hypothetical protein
VRDPFNHDPGEATDGRNPARPDGLSRLTPNARRSDAMTETYAADRTADDIDDALDTPSARLDRQADALLEEGRTFESRPIRRAVREDVAEVRNWGRERGARLRGAVEAEPVRASLYALGLGVVIGMLISR